MFFGQNSTKTIVSKSAFILNKICPSYLTSVIYFA